MGCPPLILSKDFLLSRRKINEDGCWLYMGAQTSEGYGTVKSQQKDYRVHRLAAHYWLGLDLENKLIYACHKCDVKLCFNPDHLFIGDNKSNQIDARNKGILKIGENSCSAKLTAKQVLEIRKNYSRYDKKNNLCKFAKKYGVGTSQLWRIIKRQSWGHI